MTPEVAHFDPFAGAPRLNCARRVGVRPGTELILPLAASGARPLRFEVTGLPDGLRVDDEGIVRGTVPAEQGTHTLQLKVSNRDGAVADTVDLVVGYTLALTPPMGWNSWNVYAHTVNADVIVAAARALVATGMRDLGYRYINIDDHWHAPQRGPGGEPLADPVKFPDGIAAVAAEVHALGLQLGIYSDAAHLTCGGCYGGYGYERIDAAAYADWGVDLLKYDYCYAPSSAQEARRRYRAMAAALEASGRSIVLSVCEWGLRKPWTWAAGVGGSLWRTTPDIFDNFGWTPVGVRFIARRNLRLADFAGPGRWNDPDMLVVGNRGAGLATGVLRIPNQWPRPFVGRRVWSFRGLNDRQVHSHVSLWAMMAAPLLASHDLAASSPFDLALLTNPEILAIDQDPLGAQGRLVPARPGLWQVVKPLADGGFAVSVTNLTRLSRHVVIDLEALARHSGGTVAGHSGATAVGTLAVSDAWTLEELGSPAVIRRTLPPHGTVVLVCRPAV